MLSCSSHEGLHEFMDIWFFKVEETEQPFRYRPR